MGDLGIELDPGVDVDDDMLMEEILELEAYEKTTESGEKQGMPSAESTTTGSAAIGNMSSETQAVIDKFIKARKNPETRMKTERDMAKLTKYLIEKGRYVR